MRSLSVGAPQFHAEITTAPVDDVFHLVPVEMDGGGLPFAHEHDFLAVGLAVACGVSVAYREERQPFLCEVPLAEVGDVPAQRVVAYFAACFAVRAPHAGSPCCPFGEQEAVFGKEIQCFAD